MLYIENIYNYDDDFYQKITLPEDINIKYEKYYFKKDKKVCKIWTAKEAYSKCLGTGLSNELNKVNLIDVINNGKYKDYLFEFIEKDNKFIICKCTKN